MTIIHARRIVNKNARKENKESTAYIIIDLKAMGMGTRPKLNWLRTGTNGFLL
jgi:hypothetical protein